MVENDYLSRLQLNEPYFTLRAQDKTAATVVEIWALLAEAHGSPHEKVADARRIANEMRGWPNQKVPD